MQIVDVDGQAVDDNSLTDEHARWVQEIMLYDREAQRWHTKSKKIIKRYKDERTVHDESRARYNILWSNVQTLMPAVYARNPKVDIERKFKQKDDLGRMTGEILERTTAYFIENQEFGRVMLDCILDRLLAGRGTAWARYMPHFRDASVEGLPEVQNEGTEITDTAYGDDGDQEEPVREVYNEEVCFDYIHYTDFGHNIARTIAEIHSVWRMVYMSRMELIERFGKEKAMKIPLDYSPKGLNDEKIADDMKKATIYEIWCLDDKTVRWLHKDQSELLDKRPDPLGLKGFFPCPMPILATTANDSLIPVPDYVEYQDQAKELDMLTARIASVTKAIKVAGVYDTSAEGVGRLLSEGVENQLIPIEQWAVFGEKGGLKGVMDLLPVQEIAQTLLVLYEAREKVKGDLYEITGIADIIRGQSNPNETATAQNIKGQFANLRLSALQGEIQRFARDLVRIAAQIIAQHFSMETIKKICGVKLLTAQEKQQIQMQQQQAQMPPQQQQPGMPPAPPPPPPPPMTEEMMEMMQNPTWEEVEQLLRDEMMLGFRVDIETDSTIKQDEDSEKQSRIELLTAVSAFLQQSANIQDPVIKVLMAELLGFGVRSFRAGKQVEGAIQLAISEIEKQAQNPAPPPPDPEMLKIQSQEKIETMKMQATQQAEQMRMQADQQNGQQAAQLEQQKMQLQMQADVQRNQMEAERSARDKQMEMELKKYEIDGKLQLQRELGMIDRAIAAKSADAAATTAAQTAANPAPESSADSGLKDIVTMLQDNLSALYEQSVAPKSISLTRDKQGNIQSGEVRSVR